MDERTKLFQAMNAKPGASDENTAQLYQEHDSRTDISTWLLSELPTCLPNRTVRFLSKAAFELAEHWYHYDDSSLLQQFLDGVPEIIKEMQGELDVTEISAESMAALLQLVALVPAKALIYERVDACVQIDELLGTYPDLSLGHAGIMRLERINDRILASTNAEEIDVLRTNFEDLFDDLAEDEEYLYLSVAGAIKQRFQGMSANHQHQVAEHALVVVLNAHHTPPADGGLHLPDVRRLKEALAPYYAEYNTPDSHALAHHNDLVVALNQILQNRPRAE